MRANIATNREKNIGSIADHEKNFLVHVRVINFRPSQPTVQLTIRTVCDLLEQEKLVCHDFWSIIDIVTTCLSDYIMA